MMTKRDLPSLRHTVQAAFALFCLFAGYRFWLFYRWITGVSPEFVPRPPSVEAFLPISALVSTKRLVLTGHYDPVHPAGLTIFLAALAIALLLRKGFCGWICPVGFASHALDKLTRRFRIQVRLPRFINLPLLSLKYLLLAFFAYLILWKMDLRAIEGFQRSPYNLVVDAKMLYFFLAPTPLTLWIVGGLLLASAVVRNFWCRSLCPYGALLGLLALASPFAVQRQARLCIDCKKCDRSCPSGIDVSNRLRVWSAECIGCTECVAACPVPNCLDMGLAKRTVPVVLLPVLVVALFLASYATALFSGHWHNQIPLDILKRSYASGLSIPHPR